MLCQCFCAPGLRGLGSGAANTIDITLEDEAPGFDSIVNAPRVAGHTSYSTSVAQPLRGVPIREGQLWYLSAEDRIEPVEFSLFINGFSFVQEGQEVAVVFSPFSLVRNCKFQSNMPDLGLSMFKIFKVSWFSHGICYYFGVKGRDGDDRSAEEERSKWVLDISHAMRLVTQSLFPKFAIAVNPIPGAANTQSRLMAGFLAHHDDPNSVSILYCELHAHSTEGTRMVLYEDEKCMTPILTIQLFDKSLCCEKVGINCSCFTVEDHDFSSCTMSERKLWLRAISNVKVKLQSKAPDPTPEELTHFRAAIRDYVSSMRDQRDSRDFDALLQRCPKKQFQVVGGGDVEPLPWPPPDEVILAAKAGPLVGPFSAATPFVRRLGGSDQDDGGPAVAVVGNPAVSAESDLQASATL
mmetsp:Transcript_15124/g.33372  ORF Transcript_15124/g.33372 Transcript_15124/m.33372 type:complete len:410 (-) Transcript_15124:67-1296(-)